MKTYKGQRLAEGCEVYVFTGDGRSYPLPLRLEIRSHSPTGFEWGYGGSGPAQLALAILADHFGSAQAPAQCPYCSGRMDGWKCSYKDCGFDGNRDGDKWAHIQGGMVHYQDFKEVIAKLPKDGFELTAEQIDAWARKEAV